jgi:hypothetical protein
MDKARIRIKKFLSLLFPENDSYGLIEVREFRQNLNYPFKKTFKTAKELCSYFPSDNCDVFFGIYKRGYKRKKGYIDGSIENCLHTRAIYLDFDGIELEQIKENIKKNKIPYPTAIIDSGHGYHCYWFLTEKYFDITTLIKAMQKATGSDPKAVDKARILRLPSSWNTKDTKNPKKCDIVELNDNRYDIKVFLDIFNIRIERSRKKSFTNTIDLNSMKINRHCITEMLNGVPDGFRHFSLGRLTKYFQQNGYKQNEVRQTLLNWNQRCNPSLPENEILSSFYKYWTTDYKLLGCNVPDITLQAKLSRFCCRKKCKFPIKDCKLDLSQSFGLNNLIFNDYRKKTGQQIIIFGLLLRHAEGLTSDQLEDKLTGKATGKPCIGRDNRKKALHSLKTNGFIKIVPKNRKAGEKDFYRVIKRGTFGRGFTVLTHGAINGAIDLRITPLLLKIYVLLCNFGWSELATPSLETLSKETGIPRSGISYHLHSLEEADYIKRYYKVNSKGANKLICKLLL